MWEKRIVGKERCLNPVHTYLMCPWSAVGILVVWEVRRVFLEGQRWLWAMETPSITAGKASPHQERDLEMNQTPFLIYCLKKTWGCRRVLFSVQKHSPPSVGFKEITFVWHCVIMLFCVTWRKIPALQLSWSWSHMIFTCRPRMCWSSAMWVSPLCQNDRNVRPKNRLSPPSGLPAGLMWSPVPRWQISWDLFVFSYPSS